MGKGWNKMKQVGRCGALAAVLIGVPAFANDIPTPLDCVDSKFQQDVNNVLKDVKAAEDCKLNSTAPCNRGPRTLMVKGKGESLCENMYYWITEAADKYKTEYEKKCQALNAKLADCQRRKAGSSDQFQCLHQHHDQLVSAENYIAQLLMENQQKLQELERLADEARKKYRANAQRYASNKFLGPYNNPHCVLYQDALVDQNCLGPLAANRCGKEIFGTDPNVDGPIIQEQTRAMERSLNFRQIAFNVASGHQTRAKDFTGRSQQMADLANRMKTAEGPQPPAPQDKKGPSDITGTENKQPPQQQAGGPQGGGGGGPQGGGGGSPSGSGPAQGFDQGGGSNAGTPPSMNGGNKSLADSGPKNKSNKVASNSPGSTAPTGDGLKSPIGSTGLITGGGGSPDFGGAGSRGLASSGSGRTSSAASASSPGGGGGGGLGGGGGGGGAAGCIGKECTQVMGATGSQFAGAGNLGAGGGFGADGAGDALDNLFKSDDKAAVAGAEGPGADALGGLEGTLDNSLDGGASGELASGGEIGAANGADLFERVKTTYVRAQKKGFVAGMLKKL